MAKSTNLDAIGDKVITMLSRKNEARERGLPLSREAIRHCANAIRAIHRAEFSRAETLLQGARIRIEEMKKALAQNPELRYGSFVFDAEKEYSEGQATLALVRGDPLPDPEELGVDYAAYVNGLGEAIGEMRRHLLDELRRGDPLRIEDLLSAVDDIYNLLISVDFPDAITVGLRRTTDVARSVLEKTRGDITLAFQQRSLERRLREIEANLQRLSLPAASPVSEAAPSQPVGTLRRRPAAPSRPVGTEVQAPSTPLEVHPQLVEGVAETPAVAMPPVAVSPQEAPPRRRRRRRKPTLAVAEAAPVAVAPAPVALAPAPPAPEAAAEAVAGAPVIGGGELVPKRRRRRRRRHPAAAVPEASPLVGTPSFAPAAPVPEAPAVPPVAGPETGPAPKRRRRRHHRRRPAAAPVPSEAMVPVPEESGPPPQEALPSGPEPAPQAEAEPRRRRRYQRRPAAVTGSTEAAPEPASLPEAEAPSRAAVEAVSEVAARPRRPGRRPRSAGTTAPAGAPPETPPVGTTESLAEPSPQLQPRPQVTPRPRGRPRRRPATPVPEVTELPLAADDETEWDLPVYPLDER